MRPCIQKRASAMLTEGRRIMIVLVDWLVPSVIGVTFTLMGSLKLYGLHKGIVGGHDQPLVKQLCGT
jgi:hypothetical protein